MMANLPDYPDSQLDSHIRGRFGSGGIDALLAAHIDLCADQIGGIGICLIAEHGVLGLILWLPRPRRGEGMSMTDDMTTLRT